jgi:hypothetical protein
MNRCLKSTGDEEAKTNTTSSPTPASSIDEFIPFSLLLFAEPPGVNDCSTNPSFNFPKLVYSCLDDRLETQSVPSGQSIDKGRVLGFSALVG